MRLYDHHSKWSLGLVGEAARIHIESFSIHEVLLNIEGSRGY